MPDPTGRVSHLPDMHRGVAWKAAVRMASTGNLTLSGLQTVDGIVGAAGDSVLVKNQTSAPTNGIYVMASGAWARRYDMDQDTSYIVPAEEILGAVVKVLNGTVNAGTFWQTTNASVPVIGTDAITWAAFASITPAPTSLSALTDVTITSLALDNMLFYNGSKWINLAAIWRPLMDGTGNVITDAGTGEAVMALS